MANVYKMYISFIVKLSPRIIINFLPKSKVNEATHFDKFMLAINLLQHAVQLFAECS